MPDASNLMKCDLLDRAQEPDDEDLVNLVRGMGKEAMDAYNAAMSGFHEKWVERARNLMADHMAKNDGKTIS